MATVRILSEEMPIALGVVVDANGWILTKASQLTENVTCALPDGTTKEATIVARSEEHDVALLKVNAPNLKATEFATSEPFKVGTIVIVPNSSDKLIGMGIIGSAPRRIPPQTDFGAFVRPISVQDPRPKIVFVGQHSAAETAGLKIGDIVSQIENRKLKNCDDFREAILTKRSGQSVRVKVERGSEQLDFRLALFAPQGSAVAVMVDRFDAAYGISKRRDDFPLAFQHDVDMRTESCGGPVLNLQGQVIGINIARKTRAETFAIPIREALSLFPQLSQVSIKLGPVSKNPPGDPASRKQPARRN